MSTLLLSMALAQGPAQEPPEIQRPKALEEDREEEKEAREDQEKKAPEDAEEHEAEDEQPGEAPGQPASRPETPFEPGPPPETPLKEPAEPAVEPTPAPAPRPAPPKPEPWEPEPNEEAKAAWRAAHQGLRGRLGFAVSLSGYAFIPPPPAVAGGLGVFLGGKLVPKFRNKKVLRDRSLGYWGQVNATAAPFSILHRHMFAIAGSGGPRASIFYEVGGGFVHYGCCGSDLPGGTVGAFAGWRIHGGSERAFVLGVPLMIDMLINADVRGSIGIGAALTNI